MNVLLVYLFIYFFVFIFKMFFLWKIHVSGVSVCNLYCRTNNSLFK